MRDDWKEKRREWVDENKYNSFNSYKGLNWSEKRAQIATWFKGDSTNLPAPIELSLDPTHLCNLKCKHCNAQRYLIHEQDQVPKGSKKMSGEHLRNLIDVFSDWGVRGVCQGGGGEPLMNKDVWTLPSYIASKQIIIPRIEEKVENNKTVYNIREETRPMESSFATNGVLINEQIAEEMMNCRWVGVSPDSGSREVYEKVHGVDKFDKVIDNLKLLVKKKRETGSQVDLAYKFLITPDNWVDLEKAAKIARDIGVQDFHARPADLERIDITRITGTDYGDLNKKLDTGYDHNRIQEMFERIKTEYSSSDFKLYTVMHKYDENFKVEHKFKNCVSSPLMIQACADGNAYVCADHRIESRFKLIEHYPNPEKILDFWGSDEHRKLLNSIKVNNECGRCTYGEYARQIEELDMGSKVKDPMCDNFP